MRAMPGRFAYYLLQTSQVQSAHLLVQSSTVSYSSCTTVVSPSPVAKKTCPPLQVASRWHHFETLLKGKLQVYGWGLGCWSWRGLGLGLEIPFEWELTPANKNSPGVPLPPNRSPQPHVLNNGPNRSPGFLLGGGVGCKAYHTSLTFFHSQ